MKLKTTKPKIGYKSTTKSMMVINFVSIPPNRA